MSVNQAHKGGEGGISGLSRRSAITGGVAALAALMLRHGHAEALQAARQDSRHEFANTLADLVLPDTATPGAGKADAGAFVLLALDHQMGGLTPELLTRVQAHLDGQVAGSFLQLPRDGAEKQLEALDQQAYSQREPAASSVEHAWQRIKSAIVSGYYTSEIGASQELIYEPVPGHFADIQLTPNFKCRSNDGFGGAL